MGKLCAHKSGNGIGVTLPQMFTIDVEEAGKENVKTFEAIIAASFPKSILGW